MSEWKPIAGWPLYEVSSEGQVRMAGGPVLGQWSNDQGYMLVRLRGPRAVMRVHVLVATAFIANPETKPNVNHIDCSRSNNNVHNLEWCTQTENLQHMTKLGRRASPWLGKRSPNAKMSTQQVSEIRAMYDAGGISLQCVANRFSVSKRAIGRIVNRETYADVL